ncbi:hypothetical protein GAS19_11625 [Burkholderia glumae]|nr:hypothetical protein GAS19_11625 [Burkholderia glumae]
MERNAQQEAACASLTFIDVEFQSHLIGGLHDSHVAMLAGKRRGTKSEHIAYFKTGACFKRMPAKAQ